MGKTNEERARINNKRIEETIQEWEHDYCTALDDDQVRWLVFRVCALVSHLVRKAERRGAKKACIMCCEPAPQRYTRDEAQQLADRLQIYTYNLATAFSHADKMNGAYEAVIDAITSSAKPAPQFDADRVRVLVDELSLYAKDAFENTDDLGDMYWSSFMITVGQLQAALHIE